MYILGSVSALRSLHPPKKIIRYLGQDWENTTRLQKTRGGNFFLKIASSYIFSPSQFDKKLDSERVHPQNYLEFGADALEEVSEFLHDKVLGISKHSGFFSFHIFLSIYLVRLFNKVVVERRLQIVQTKVEFPRRFFFKL